MTGWSIFADALTAPDAPRPAMVVGPDGRTRTSRYDVYRNNVTVGLTEALASGFPVVRQLVGPEFFAAMAREFLRAHPPTDPVMALYGAALPDWIAAFPPVAHLPYLSAVARLEYLRREATHAADAEPLDPASLAGLAPEALARSFPRPHPSARWIDDPQPALAIWNRHNGSPGADDPAGEILICRPRQSLIQIAAPKGTGATLAALAQGRPLARALPAAADPAAIFATLFTAGALLPSARG